MDPCCDSIEDSLGDSVEIPSIPGDQEGHAIGRLGWVGSDFNVYWV